jgi:quercetin dioxygenase-like cupin family protein
MELAPVGDDFNEFVRTALVPWADQNDAGMHRTPTMDYNIVLAGTVGLELDGGAEVVLEPGDVVVQNATRHRWHNRGATVARVLSVQIGAHDQRG